jgi:hypothetical protein
MSRALYRLPDEPQPSAAAQYVVDPFWPLLSTMMAGAWLGLPWLAINGWLFGSPTRVREALLCAAGLVGAVVLYFAIVYAIGSGLLDKDNAEYAVLAIVAWKLACAYAATMLQSSSLELYEYFGGTKKNGVIVLLLGAFLLRPVVLGALAQNTLVLLVLG